MWTGREHLHRLARFWTKIFAVSFAMGVVSGIVLSYQFGTNWSRFSVVVGNVIGPLIGYEVLTAFFLEATFLGVMLFGWKRVPPWLHVLSAIFVAIGTAISAFWILSANSWMQTPAGHEIRDGIAYPVDWLAIIFNPSFPYRFAHMLTAAYLTTSLVVLAVGARYLLAGKHLDEGTHHDAHGGRHDRHCSRRCSFSSATSTASTRSSTSRSRSPRWRRTGTAASPATLVLFAWPDEKAERNHFEISIPKGASLILTHDPNGLFPGLKSVPPSERPPVVPVFFAFRIMVGHRLLHDRGRPDRRAGCGGAARLFDTRWYLLAGVDVVVAGLRRGDRRLGGDRKRPPALDRARHPAHRRRDLAGAGRDDRIDARAVRAGLRHRVHHGHLLHQPPDREGTAGPRRSSRRKRARRRGRCRPPPRPAAKRSEH